MGLLFNYGCYVFIENQLKDTTLTLTQSDSLYGTWALPPPPTISPGEKVRIELDDTTGPAGSEGIIEYTFRPETMFPIYIRLHFACPTASLNYVEVTPKSDRQVQTVFYAKSGSDVYEPIETGNWGAANECPKFGHPLAMHLIIKGR